MNLLRDAQLFYCALDVNKSPQSHRKRPCAGEVWRGGRSNETAEEDSIQVFKITTIFSTVHVTNITLIIAPLLLHFIRLKQHMKS